MRFKLSNLLLVILCVITLIGATAVFASAAPGGPKPKLSVKACNLSFEESVHILYAIEYENVDYSDIEMLYWTTPRKNKNDYLKENAEYTSTGGKKTTVNGVENCVVFENTQLWARDMTDVLYARAYVKVNGVEYYSEVKSYSILEYVYNKLGYTGTPTANEKLKALVAELIEYGAKTQHYFDHNMGTLPTDPHGKVEVEGGMLPDGMESGIYKEDTEVTLTAITTPEAPYVKWVDAEGNVVGYGETITVKVGSMTTNSYTAICYALYDVRFVDTDGTVIKTVEELLLGDEFTPPVMDEREGYTFLGWATSKGGDAVYSPDTTAIVMGADNTDTYYAVWLPDEIEGTEGLQYYGPYDDGNGGYYYAVSGYTGTATEIVIGNTYNGYPVRGIGGGAFSGNTAITKVTICDGIEYLSDMAFYGCANLTKVLLPDSLTSIGNNCFNACASLESISIPDGVTSIETQTFIYCANLTKVVLPDTLTTIGVNSFWGCTSLESINIPDGVTSIGYQAFKDCASLTSIAIPDGVTVIEEYTFNGCTSLVSVTLGNEVSSIGYAAFSGCSALTEIELPDTLTTIGGEAFAWCTALTAIELPETLTEIGGWTFYRCSSLTSIRIPDSVTTIGSSAFESCSNLKSVTIGTGMQFVGGSAFNSCSILNSVNITDLDKWYLINFENAGSNPLDYAHDLKVNGEAVTEVVIADGTEYIGSYAFAGLTTLTKVTIPESVKSIGEGAFYNCINLTNTALPSGITEIGAYTFCNCDTITEITIPDSVTVIGDNAFNHCELLAKVSFGENSRLTTIGNDAFSYCSKLADIKLPSELTVIGDEAFTYCYSLVEVVIPDSVTDIYAYAFSYCNSLRRVYIPDGVTVIGYYAFYDCTGATIFAVAENAPIEWNSSWCPSDSLIVWGYEKTASTEDGIEYALGKDGAAILEYTGDATALTIPDEIEGKAVVAIAAYAFRNHTELVTVDIPKSVVYIGEYAFNGCTSLTEIVIPDGVTAIRQSTFGDCYNLKSVTLGTGVKSIGDVAFNNCTRLTDIVLPEGLESIGWSAFGSCHSLARIVIPESVTVIEGYAFNGSSIIIIYVKAESQPEGWDPDWNANDYPVVWGHSES